MSTTPLAALALIQPFLSSVEIGFDLREARALGISGVLDRGVGGDDKGIALGVWPVRRGLTMARSFSIMAQLFIGHRDLAPAGARRRKRPAPRRSPRRPPPAAPASSRRRTGYSAARPWRWSGRAPTSRGAARAGRASGRAVLIPAPRAGSHGYAGCPPASCLAAGFQHEQAGDLFLVHEGQGFGGQLAGLGDLGILRHHLATPCGSRKSSPSIWRDRSPSVMMPVSAALVVHDADTAEASLAPSPAALRACWRPRAASGNSVARVHQVGDPDQGAAQRTAGMKIAILVGR